MKETKDTTFELRLTKELKQQIKDYCSQYGYSMSEFIRMACEKIMGGNNNE